MVVDKSYKTKVKVMVRKIQPKIVVSAPERPPGPNRLLANIRA